MDNTAMREETEALLHYLQDRGLTEPAACVVMGMACISLINGREKFDTFLSTMRTVWEAEHKSQEE